MRWQTVLVSDSHPELEGYVPHEERPLRGRRTTWLIRIGVILAVGGFVLPGIMTIVGGGNANAQNACAVAVGQQSAQAAHSSARFELFGPGFVGWECYAVSLRGVESFVASLGLIPVAPPARPAPDEHPTQPA